MNCVRASDYFDKKPPLTSLYINSCGYFSDIETETKARRLKGRPDYQLIGVVSGCMEVKQTHGTVCVNAGRLILFKPGQPQIYGMDNSRSDEKGAYFWIHFDGGDAEEILKDCMLYDDYASAHGDNNNNKDACIFDVGVSIKDTDIIYEMMSEMSLKARCYRLRLQSLFIQLLTSLSRRTPDTAEQRRSMDKIRPAVRAMEADGGFGIRVKDYADMCLMSEYYFIHCFKEAIGMTPMRYKNMIVMEKVKSLLGSTDMSLKEIAERCGISDSLYLCKKFKQAFGYTPTEYRRKTEI